MACNNCNISPCSCVPIEETPCLTCDCNPGYCNDGCPPDSPKSSCVIIDEDIECFGIEEGDTLTEALVKVADVACEGLNVDDKYVKVSSGDTTASYLQSKLSQGVGIIITKTSPSGNEGLTVAAKISEQTGNNLYNDGGLFVPPSPTLVINSTNSSISHTPSGSLDHIQDLNVRLSTNAGNAISNTGSGLFVAPEEHKVKINSGDTADYLINQIVLKADPLGIVVPQAITTESGKLNIGYTIDLEVLCTALNELPCFTAEDPTCSIEITSVASTALEGGTLTATVSYTGSTPILFAYKIDSGSYVTTTLNPFTITGLSTGSHTLYVKAMCANGVYGNVFSKSITIPTNSCSANLLTFVSSNANNNGTVSLSWTATGASYYTYQIGSGSIITTTNTSVNLTSQSAGSHSVTLKAYCANDLLGDTMTLTYIIPTATCSATINSLVISAENTDGTATATWTATGASTYKYKVDTGTFTTTSMTSVSLTGLTIGGHTITVVAICANAVEGSSASANISIPGVVECNPPSGVVISDVTPTEFTAYWGVKPTGAVLTEEEIEDSTHFDTFPLDGDVVADFSYNTDPMFLWVAIPTSEPERVTWYANVLDNGTYSSGQTFDFAGVVGAYNFYQSNYATSQSIIEFRD